jgi:(2Fe-2S) ferredoxin
MATRCGCFGMCAAGPITVVYPDGTWYGMCDEVALDRIIREHLLGGQIVTDYVIRAPQAARDARPQAARRPQRFVCRIRHSPARSVRSSG